jgi:multiple sugar transport system permease protein
MVGRKRRRAGNLITYVLLAVVLILFLFPVYYLLTTALKSQTESFAIPPVWFFKPTLDSFRSVLTSSEFGKGLVNSIIVAPIASLIATFLGSLAAYSFSRYNYRQKNNISFFILSVRMFPPIVAVLPYFIMGRLFNILDTRFFLIIVYLTFTISFASWVMKGFFDSIPREIDESGLVDGYNPFQIFWKLILRCSRAGFFAVLSLNLVFTWNEYLFALILTGRNAKTLPIVANSYIKAMGIAWGEMMSAGIIIALPMVVFGFLIRKYLITGLTLGAYTQK